MTYTVGNINSTAISFISTSGTQQKIFTAGKTLFVVNFNGVGGSWQLQDAFVVPGGIVHAAGALDVNGQTVTSDSSSSASTSVRSLTLGASSMTFTGSSETPWFFNNVGNLTFNAGSSTITLTGSNIGFTGGGFAYNTLQILSTGGAMTGNKTLNDSNTFNSLIVQCANVKTDFLNLAANQTVYNVLIASGNSPTNRLLFESDTLGTPRTITIATATVTAANIDFRDVTFSVSTNLSAITGGSGDCGGNSGITFTTPATQNLVRDLWWKLVRQRLDEPGAPASG